MDILKRFTRGFCSQLFKLSLFFAAVAAAVLTVFGTPTSVKDAVKTSGVYEKAVSSVIDHAKKEQSKQGERDGEDGIPLDDPAIKSAIEDALPPDYLEETATGVIDSVFAWLQGKTESPQFTVDLSDAKQRLATGIAGAAYTRAQTLPPCTLQQLQTMDTSSVDIFSLPCLPPGVNLEAERDKLASSIASGKEFLEDSTITSEDLPKDNGETAFDKAGAVPTAYQWFTKSPWIFGAVAVLMAAGMILLHDDRRRGIWVIGRTLLITGILLLVAGLLAKFLIDKAQIGGEVTLQATLATLLQTLSGQFNNVLIKFGAGYAVLGAGTILAIHFTKPKMLERELAEDTSSAPDEASQQPAVPVETTEPDQEKPKSS